jgi:hypothetical protein
MPSYNVISSRSRFVPLENGAKPTRRRVLLALFKTGVWLSESASRSDWMTLQLVDARELLRQPLIKAVMMKMEVEAFRFRRRRFHLGFWIFAGRVIQLMKFSASSAAFTLRS